MNYHMGILYWGQRIAKVQASLREVNGGQILYVHEHFRNNCDKISTDLHKKIVKSTTSQLDECDMQMQIPMH